MPNHLNVPHVLNDSFSTTLTFCDKVGFIQLNGRIEYNTAEKKCESTTITTLFGKIFKSNSGSIQLIESLSWIKIGNIQKTNKGKEGEKTIYDKLINKMYYIKALYVCYTNYYQ